MRLFYAFTAVIVFSTLLAAQEAAPAKKLLRLTLDGPIIEVDPPMGFFGNTEGVTFRRVRSAIRDAAADPAVAGLVLRVRQPAAGWTQIQSLRKELLRFRDTGKRSHCYLTEAGWPQFLLASATDDVSMVPTGRLSIPGLGMHVLFMKDLLAKLGIHFQELRMGRYKSAVEPITRSAPSEPTKEQMHSLLDALFGEYVTAISENRGLDAGVVRGLIDQGYFSPSEALETKLIDHVEYEDEFLSRVQGLGADRLELSGIRLKKKMDMDFSGFAGLMKLVNELMGVKTSGRFSGKPRLALVTVEGAIVTSSDNLFGASVISSRDVTKIFRELRDDENVKAIVFRINSGGGSALASDVIWREVKITSAKKPVVVSMGDMAASGGYYIACPATRIFAERGTLTGSIGVIGALPNVRELFDTIGLKFSSFTRGKRANMASPYGELTEDGRAVWMEHIGEIYDVFLSRVAEGRSRPVEAVAAVAEGRVWTGAQALEHGLVDEIGGLGEAMAHARELAKLPLDAEIQSLPRPRTLFDMLNPSSGDVALRVALRALPAEAKALVKRAGWLEALRTDRVLTVMPEVILIR